MSTLRIFFSLPIHPKEALKNWSIQCKPIALLPKCSIELLVFNKFAILNYTVLILGVHAPRSYLKLICEYELHSLTNKKLVAQRTMVKTTSRSDRLWSAIFSAIVYCCRELNITHKMNAQSTILERCLNDIIKVKKSTLVMNAHLAFETSANQRFETYARGRISSKETR